MESRYAETLGEVSKRKWRKRRRRMGERKEKKEKEKKENGGKEREEGGEGVGWGGNLLKNGRKARGREIIFE